MCGEIETQSGDDAPRVFADAPREREGMPQFLRTSKCPPTRGTTIVRTRYMLFWIDRPLFSQRINCFFCGAHQCTRCWHRASCSLHSRRGGISLTFCWTLVTGFCVNHVKTYGLSNIAKPTVPCMFHVPLCGTDACMVDPEHRKNKRSRRESTTHRLQYEARLSVPSNFIRLCTAVM